LGIGAAQSRKRVLSGMRPTGRLHIGHYFGALRNWVRLQNDPGRKTPEGVPEYECFYFIADWHALTSDYADTSAVAQNTIEIATDYLAAGIDPVKSVIFLQSLVPEHAELHLLLSMVTPLGWLERVPTYKEALENSKDKDLHTYGFLGYPALQTADIVMYSEHGLPLLVPVGEDQVSHVELSREIVRRFNGFYGLRIQHELLSDPGALAEVLSASGISAARGSQQLPPGPLTAGQKLYFESEIRRVAGEIGLANLEAKVPQHSHFFSMRQILREPEALLTTTPRIPGLDGRKMSKSYGNAITLSETDADIRAKTKVMVTDPARKRRSDPGDPDKCPVYDWHKLFSAGEPGRLAWVETGCRSAGIGCIECKSAMADNLIAWITPMRERRVEYEKHPGRVLEIVDAGSRRARAVAQATMQRVREAVFGWERKRNELAG
jgi:tryptophanyl-tRNA synthetase